MRDAGSPSVPPSLAADRRAHSTRRRESERRALAVGLLISVAVHAMVLAAWPWDGSGESARASQAPRLVVLPPYERVEAEPQAPRVELPAPAQPVARPAEPALAPPSAPDAPGEPVWIPHEVPPRLLNAAEVQAALAGSRLDGAGEAGSEHLAVLWLYVDRSGEVRKLQLRQSSGSTRLDTLVQQAARAMEFSPALNQGRTVAVWISQPVRFSFRGDTGGGTP